MMSRFKIIGVLSCLLLASNLMAQVKEGLRTIVKEDKVYIYHNLRLDAGYGFDLYRDDQKLNGDPIMGELYPEDFTVLLGDQYESLAKMMQADSPSNLFFKLKSNLPMQRLAIFLNPTLAKGLGKLYIDYIKADGREVKYTMVVVNNLGEETDRKYETKVLLRPEVITPATNLEASNNDRRVTLKWSYPKPSKRLDDKVIQFDVFRQTEAGLEKLNEGLILRNGAQSKFGLSFETAQVGYEDTYVVNAVDISGDYQSSKPLNYLIKDNTAPGAVSGLNTLVRNNTIAISWNASTDLDVAGYHVYRSQRMREGYKKVSKVLIDPLSTYFVDSLAREGKSLSYKVSAIDKSGNESELSLAVQARINDHTAPDVITGFTAALNQGAIQLKWKALEEREDFRSYIVLRQQLKSGAKTYVRLNDNDLRNSQWRDLGRGGKGFTEGASYQYCVLAMDSARNFSDSVFTTLQIPDLTPPTAPDVVQATNQNGLHTMVRWTASHSADTEYYQVYRANTEQKEASQRIAQLPRNIRKYKDKDVIKGQSYQYTVTAMDSLGNEGEVTTSKIVLVKDNEPPRSVRNVMVDLSKKQIVWEPVVAFDLAGYNIYQADIPTGEFKKINTEVWTETFFTSTTLAPGKWYRVRSVDVSGNESKPSNPKQAK